MIKSPTIVELSNALQLIESEPDYPETGMLKAFNYLLARVVPSIDHEDMVLALRGVVMSDRASNSLLNGDHVEMRIGLLNDSVNLCMRNVFAQGVAK